MSLFAQLIQRRSVSESSLANPQRWLLDYYAGEESITGVRINADRARRISAVYACVRILAETIGSLPLQLYRRLPDGGKERATDHPLYTLMHDAPNEEMTSMELRETSMGHTALRGNSYAQIVHGGDGRPHEIIPFHPDRVKPERDRAKRLKYRVTTEDGQQHVYDKDEILHIRGLGANGIVGYDPITLARETMGLAVATETHGAKFFANGATPTGFIEHPQSLKDSAFARLRDTFTAAYTGLQNSHKPIILEEGAKFQPIQLNHEQAQFLETRKFQVTEIARWFRIPPHMIADLERSTNNNIEHQSLEFVIHTMLPWITRHEQRYNRSLLLPGERAEYFFELDIDGLLRGDIKSRYEAFQIAKQNGWLNADEIRAMENMNPLANGAGAKYVMQSSFVPVDMLGQKLKPAQEPRSESLNTQPSTRNLRAILSPALTAACQRAARKEAKALAALGKRGLPASELAQFYAEHRTYLRDTLGPIFEGAGATAAVTSLADELCANAQRLAEATRNNPDAAQALTTELETTGAVRLATRALALLPA